MPIYEFECKDCHQPFSELLSLSARDEGLPCPACGSRHTQRKVSGFCVKGNMAVPTGGGGG